MLITFVLILISFCPAIRDCPISLTVVITASIKIQRAYEYKSSKNRRFLLERDTAKVCNIHHGHLLQYELNSVRKTLENR